MPEADAEGASPLDLDNHIAKEIPRQFWYNAFRISVRPEFRQKKTDGASGGFLPRPLLLRLRNPKVAEVLRKPYPQKIASAKPSPHCIRASAFSFWKSSVLRTEALQRNGCTISHFAVRKKFEQSV